MAQPELAQPELVCASSGNDQLLYFTSTSLLADDTGLVFISDRDGNPNLFHLDLASGRQRQLTDNHEGTLKSYVYFSGSPYRGFAKASVSLDADRGIAYFIQGRQVRAVDLEGRQQVIAVLVEGQMTAFTHVSPDGSRLCVPTTDARALDDDAPLPPDRPGYDVDGRVQAERLSSYLHVYDTAAGGEIERVPVPLAWVTHVQWSPAEPGSVLYNHEWPADCGVRRIWLWDGSHHRRLREEGPGRSRHDWTCHEMWERDGSAVVYHGIYHDGPAFIGRVQPDGSRTVELPLPAGWRQYGHFTTGRPGQLVTDGYYRPPGAGSEGSGRWLSLVEVDWEAGRLCWQPLAEHGSSWLSQDEHPHPILDHAGRYVYFTSDRDGRRAVYRVAVDATAAAPHVLTLD